MRNDENNKTLEKLQPLIGTWKLSGKTPDSVTDNIEGEIAIEWLPGKHAMQQRGHYTFAGKDMKSLEIIVYDADANSYPAYVYSDIHDMPIPYWWNIDGNTVTHWDSTSKYTGTISDDGKMITGGWRPTDTSDARSGATYDAVMTRVSRT